MPFLKPDSIGKSYDLVVAGTGFGAMFFVHMFLKRRSNARVLLLEWGEYHDHAWQLANQRNSDIPPEDTYVGRADEKPWFYSIGFGGGTNCWWAQTPRLSPNDFRLKTKYGIGRDWPISYDDLEPYYVQAEQVMHVAGPNDLSIRFPRSASFPQPPHHLSSVDKIVRAAMPDMHFAVPTARLRIPLPGRSACCDTGQCNLCPVEAKFTALNTFDYLWKKDNVHVCVNARVRAVETAGGIATALRFEANGQDYVAKGEILALAANGIQTPFIMLQSGMRHPALGRYLHEKRVLQAEIMLDGVDNFDGGIPTSGMNLAFLDGEFRREAAGSLIYFLNSWSYGFRPEYGRWRQCLPLDIFVEDIPQEENGVFDDGGDLPIVRHAKKRSEYCNRGAERAFEKLRELLASLPVEDIVRHEDLPTGYHVQGTVRAGMDPSDSIVDRDLVHHSYRNLLVLGTAVFPSCGTANPSLTAAAWSLRAADRLTG